MIRFSMVVPDPRSALSAIGRCGAIFLALGVALPLHAARHLFLDPAFVTESSGVSLAVNSPERSEVVIRPDRPWEQLMISFYTTVIEEEVKIRIWYICRDIDNRPNIAYAE